ncbi:hypothetical protein F750_3713 [Streptomyces sp. PAMC 26508]|nr:hypothetical protein F750_3713 [Streptomyces sp. PAMC 26508]
MRGPYGRLTEAHRPPGKNDSLPGGLAVSGRPLPRQEGERSRADGAARERCGQAAYT